MPPTWPDGRPDGDDGDDAPLTPPVHPDDRLWRHPSELGWPAAGPGQATEGVVADRRAAGPGRVWGIALASGVVGATLTLAAITVLAGIGTTTITERVIERVGVRDQLGDPMNARPSQGLPAVIAATSPSVVRLEVIAEGGHERAGSGVVFRDDGHILTNAHVVAGADAVSIVLGNGTVVAGEVVGRDELTDLAVVAPLEDAGDADWVPAILGSADDLRLGDPAVAVGAAAEPSGDPLVALGMVAALDERMEDDERTMLGLIRTDAVLLDEASGGALCDRSGRVVGITTVAWAEPSGSYATSIDLARSVADALITDGTFPDVWLGIEGIDVDTTATSLFGVNRPSHAAQVQAVVPGSPAEAAGLAGGDILVSIDDVPVDGMVALVAALRGYQPGDVAAITVRRAGEVVEVAVTLGQRSG